MNQLAAHPMFDRFVARFRRTTAVRLASRREAAPPERHQPTGPEAALDAALCARQLQVASDAARPVTH